MHTLIEYLAVFLDGDFFWQISSHQASKKDADRSRKGSISHIQCFCFTANQLKSRLLLARTAGELETHSLVLSL